MHAVDTATKTGESKVVFTIKAKFIADLNILFLLEKINNINLLTQTKTLNDTNHLN